MEHLPQLLIQRMMLYPRHLFVHVAEEACLQLPPLGLLRLRLLRGEGLAVHAPTGHHGNRGEQPLQLYVTAQVW